MMTSELPNTKEVRDLLNDLLGRDVEALRIDMTWQGEPLCVSIWTASAQTPQEGDPS